MKQTTADRIQKLTDEAMAKIGTKYTITLQDGATRRITEPVYVTAEDGDFRVYVIPAQQRTRRMWGAPPGHLLHHGVWQLEALQQGRLRDEDGRRGLGLGCVRPETGNGLFLSLPNGRRLCHARHRHVVALGLSSCALLSGRERW